MKIKKTFFIKYILFFSALMFLFSATFSQECETPFDLTNWTMEGTPDAYWRVSGSNEVIDTVDIFPATFFVSQMELIHVKINGTISVETSYDNDFIGIVFGYHKPTQRADDNPYEFFLFDWKAKSESLPQSAAFEGFRLSKYNGYITRNDQLKYFWELQMNLQSEIFSAQNITIH